MIFNIASANEPVKGIIVTYEEAETCYMLENVPTIKYESVDGVLHAVLYLEGVTEPVQSVAIADGRSLIVAFGEHVPTAVNGSVADKTTIIKLNGKIVVNGGKLIIISKDGKKYSIGGEEIK